jgi:hypothetical protein
MPVSILDLKSSAKGDFTAEAQISQRKIVYCPTQTYASLHIEPHFVSGILCALSVSASLLSGALLTHYANGPSADLAKRPFTAL